MTSKDMIPAGSNESLRQSWRKLLLVGGRRKLFNALETPVDLVLLGMSFIFVPFLSLYRRAGAARLPRTARYLSESGVAVFWSAAIVQNRGGLSKNNSIAITFHGGIGAQIISAAIYFYLRQSGYKAYADFSYFDGERYLAAEGDGRCSLWSYELDRYGLPMEAFETTEQATDKNLLTIPDGPLKSILFKKAIASPDVLNRFPVHYAQEILENAGFFKQHDLVPHEYLCIHIRRGDYLNSEVHALIPESYFISAADRLKTFCTSIVIASDAELSLDFKREIERRFQKVVFIGADFDSLATHCVMRLSSVLVCSNSQFSVTAGALRHGLSFFPTRYFKDGHQPELSKLMYEEFSQFSLLTI